MRRRGVTFEQFAMARLLSLVRYAVVLTSDRELAQDVVQEALAGRRLPIQPLPNEPVEKGPEAAARYEAFLFAGYDWDDAVKLAKIWKIADVNDAKAEAGRRLLAGQQLPIKPSPKNVASALEAKRVNAFFDAGYDYGDAVKLAKIWKTADPYTAKVRAGKKLLAGDPLPIRP